MIFINPISKVEHENWEQKISEKFSNFQYSSNASLSLIEYIDLYPQRLFNSSITEVFLNLLEEIKSNENDFLKKYFDENQNFINHGIFNLNETNNRNIHDSILPTESLDLINFVDKEILYDYLKILEGCYFSIVSLVATYSRKKRGKSIEGLDLYNCVEEIKNRFPELASVYQNTIRNGIAHGKAIFTEDSILFVDKKGNEFELSIKEFIRKYDHLIDICNSLVLGLKLFLFDSTNQNKYQIPQKILFHELKYHVNTEGWEILSIFERIIQEDKPELLIYARTTLWDFQKVQFHFFRTAYLATYFSSYHKRIFFHLEAVNSKIGKTSFAGFNSEKIRELIKENSPVESYGDVLENNLIFFVPKYKFPKFVYKIGTLYLALKTQIKIEKQKYQSKILTNKFKVRESRIHSKGSYSIVQDASVVLKNLEDVEIKDFIRQNHKTILNKVIKFSKKQTKVFNKIKFQKIKYIRVFVYEKDMRKRYLRNSGLISELICTIGFNTSKKIKNIEIYGGKIESHGVNRIVWNSKSKYYEG